MKVFYDHKLLSPPDDFSDWERNLWRMKMLGVISCYIDPETWQEVYDKITADSRIQQAMKEKVQCV